MHTQQHCDIVLHMSVGHTVVYKVTEHIKGLIPESNDGNLGHFSVSITNQSADPIAQASAIQYLEADIDSAQTFHKKFVLLKKRVGKSKFAKKGLEDQEDEDEDPDVDEATGEGPAFNDPKYRRFIHAHLVKLAQNNALHVNMHNNRVK